MRKSDKLLANYTTYGYAIECSVIPSFGEVKDRPVEEILALRPKRLHYPHDGTYVFGMTLTDG